MNSLNYDLEQHQQAFSQDPPASIETRKNRLQRLLTMLNENEENLCKVVEADFGFRHPIETQLTEIIAIRQEITFITQHLHHWMKRKTVKTPVHLFPSKSYLVPQAKGVVGIMSPWNYPLALALIPTLSALAAGNRVWLKPSERSERTSGYLASLIQHYFSPTEIMVVNGDEKVAQHFANLPFNHLFFTGSTTTGKLVAQAAADHLTPLTMELGGKSPAIIDPSVRMSDCVPRLLYGKLLNAGQTCIAPDYVLVPHALRDELVRDLKAAYGAMFGQQTPLTHPIDDRQQQRWQALLADAQQKGSILVPLTDEVSPGRGITPTLVLNPASSSLIMQEEIFGPILPLLEYNSLDEAIRFINTKPKALALYWFGHHPARLQQVLEQTRSGGVTINDTLLHSANPHLPFGGIGASGMGSYHGKHGFDTFTHYKPVFAAHSLFGLSRLGGTKLAHPPYGKTITRLMRMLRKD